MAIFEAFSRRSHFFLPQGYSHRLRFCLILFAYLAGYPDNSLGEYLLCEHWNLGPGASFFVFRAGK
jgi:hypothetical protein